MVEPTLGNKSKEFMLGYQTVREQTREITTKVLNEMGQYHSDNIRNKPHEPQAPMIGAREREAEQNSVQQRREAFTN